MTTRYSPSPYDDLIWAQAWGDPEKYALVKAVIDAESGWNASAENPNDPSVGLMQILYNGVNAAGKQVTQSPYPGYTREQLLDPQTNIVLGSRLLLGLYTRLGDAVAAASAYNQGETGYLTRGVLDSQWPYVNKIIDSMNWYMENDQFLLAQGSIDGTFYGAGVPSDITTEYAPDAGWGLDPAAVGIGGMGIMTIAALGAALLLARR